MLRISQLSKEQIANINKALKKIEQPIFDAAHLKAIKDSDVLGFRSIAGVKVCGDIHPLSENGIVESLEYGDVEQI